MAVLKKYLSFEEITAIIGEIIIPEGFQLMSQDSYNETKIANVIAATGKSAELAMAAANMAIIGVGNKRYGMFKLQDQVIDIGQLLISCGVKIRLPANTLLAEDDLTIQRLCRFYRHFIREYLRRNKYPTYIYRKYSTHNPAMNEILFRGAEYLEDLTEEQEHYLGDCIGRLDATFNTTIGARYTRIRDALKGRHL